MFWLGCDIIKNTGMRIRNKPGIEKLILLDKMGRVKRYANYSINTEQNWVQFVNEQNIDME